MSPPESPAMITPCVVDETTWNTVKNKISWSDGPWVTESDKAQWCDAYTRYTCLAVRTANGVWCGYVGVPDDHPLYRVGYHDNRVRRLVTHHFVTYADFSQGEDSGPADRRVCPLSEPSPPLWWFGFDCSHASDYLPVPMAHLRAPGYGLGEILEFFFDSRNYRTLEYVQRMCAFLAWQLQEIHRITAEATRP